jgi:molecular chaperone DnaK (HSP70)
MGERGLLHAIDFGTSNSSIIVSAADGSLTPVPDPLGRAGSESVRTSVCVRNGAIEVGEAAERAKNLDPAAYRNEFKRDFGDPIPTKLGDMMMTSDELTAEVLRFLRDQALRANPAEPELVVITVPASWEEGNKELMRSAARRAGYGTTTVELVAEPVAALAYVFAGHPDPTRRLTVMVYDLGGGTFDCAVARGHAEGYEVLGVPGGLDDVAGSRFDGEILADVRERFPASAPSQPAPGQPVPPADDTALLRRNLTLRDGCERLKWELSAASSADMLLPDAQPPARFRLDRTDFEARIRPLITQTIGECDQLLGTLGLDWPGLDRVVPVGGSSRIPLVGQLLAERRGRPVLAIDRPDIAVAYGAALYGHDLLANQQPQNVYVNGRKRMILTRQVGFAEVIGLAFDRPPAGQDVSITVTYERAAGTKATGTLTAGRAVRIKNGTIFNVTATDKS